LDQREVAGLIEVGKVNANLLQWKGATPNDLLNGEVGAYFTGTLFAVSSGLVNANVTMWDGGALPTFDNLSVNVTEWMGQAPLALSPGGAVQSVETGIVSASVDVSNLFVSIKQSGITRDSFAQVEELTEVPSYPMNPIDALEFMYKRAAHRSVTTDNTDIIYLADGTTAFASGRLINNGDSFERRRYEEF
jgi:hypothetical protein